MNAGHISSGIAPFQPLIASQTTVDGSDTLWTPAAHRLFTVTGVVKVISFFGDCSETLVESNGNETLEVGIAGDTALLIPQLAAPLTLAAGDIWSRATVVPGGILADPVVMADTDIDIVVAGATGISNGVVDFYAEWVPMSDGALLVPAVWD